MWSEEAYCEEPGFVLSCYCVELGFEAVEGGVIWVAGVFGIE